ncbi:MAG: hypothetical protein WCI74_14140 [Actinomycetes bacterium]
MIGISKLYLGQVEPSDALRYGRRSSDLPARLLQFSADKKVGPLLKGGEIEEVCLAYLVRNQPNEPKVGFYPTAQTSGYRVAYF